MDFFTSLENKEVFLETVNGKIYPLVFDKIYLNKTEMDEAAETDGVYLNRYVLEKSQGDVYRKIYNHETGKEEYEYITSIKVKLPHVSYELLEPTDDPTTYNGKQFTSVEGESNYVLQIPGIWGFDSEINYNSNGFDKEKHYENLDNTVDYARVDSISSSESGSPIDTKKWTLNFPSIGRAVSNLWDILYGKGNKEGIRKTGVGSKNTVNRNDDLTSVAGVYNNIYDTIGFEIIKNVDELDKNSIEYIYKNNDKYSYLQQEYNLNSNNKVINETDYNTKKYKQVPIINENHLSKLFYKNGDKYIYSNNKILEHKEYYISANQRIYEPTVPEDCVKKDIFGNLKKVSEGKYQIGVSYYKGSDENGSIKKNKYIFIPGKYFKKRGSIYIAAETYSPNEEETYYIYEFKDDKEQIYDEDLILDVSTGINLIPISISDILDPEEYECFGVKEDNGTFSTLLGLDTDKIYNNISVDADYYKVNENILKEKQSGKISVNDNTFTGIKKSFFETNLLHPYSKDDVYAVTRKGDQITEIFKHADNDLDLEWYQIEMSKLYATPELFEYNKYYVLDDDDNFILTNLKPDNMLIDLYKKVNYVVTQNYGDYSIGQIWNSDFAWDEDLIPNLGLVPEELIYKEKDIDELPITVYGLLLKIYQLLNLDNINDRNVNTISGALKRLQDEINRIGSYSPEYIKDLNERIQKIDEWINSGSWDNQAIIALLIELQDKIRFLEQDKAPASLEQNIIDNSEAIKELQDSQKKQDILINDLYKTDSYIQEAVQKALSHTEPVEFVLSSLNSKAYSKTVTFTNNSHYYPALNKVYVDIHIVLKTLSGSTASGILNSSNNGMPNGLVKLVDKKFIPRHQTSLAISQPANYRRTYNGRIERSLNQDFGVIVMSTSHSLNTNNSYGFLISGWYSV